MRRYWPSVLGIIICAIGWDNKKKEMDGAIIWGLGCKGVDLESLDLLKMFVEVFDVLQKWSSAERHLCPGWSPPH